MEYMQVIEGRDFEKFVLPHEFENKTIKVKIEVVDEKDKVDTAWVEELNIREIKEKTGSLENIAGMFSMYANEKLRATEKEAWGDAVREKHGFS